MRDYHFLSVNREHSKTEGFHNIYISFPKSKINSKHNLLSPEAFSSWINETIKANVYYTDYSIFNVVSYDELDEAFNDIELVVALVDKEYLDGDELNQLELRVAEDKKIPVLPILFEAKHIAIFNEKFSHKQCITYKKDHNIFIEQLESYIFKTLEGGMSYDINEIQNIFTSPIFLSYRKKDKNKLKDFLFELHNFDALKPYPFWYDDFLNPGINYDEEIKEVLDKSNIFILFITKNIFEEGNYVLDLEYPYALKNHKKIIGIITNGVSKKLAKETFKEIDTFIKVDDLDETVNLLTSILEENKINTPYDRFLLAQSYYYGIGVEKNKDIAFDLFFDSYEQGEIKASKYLANSFFTNDMSSSNILKAIELQKIYIDFISGKGINFKQNIEEKRLLVKYLISSFNYKEALEVSMKNVDSCEFDTIYYFDCFLDNIEILLNSKPFRENTIKLLEKYVDKMVPYSETQDDRTIIQSLRLSYLYALYYYNLGSYDEASSFISNYEKIIFSNHIFSHSENIDLVAKTLFLNAKIFEKLDFKELANNSYSNAFIFASFEKSLNLSYIADISLFKTMLLDDSDNEDTINSYIQTSAYLAEEDRTRFDALHAYFLSLSNLFINKARAIYLYERYTQIDINSFIDEKIFLYSSLFTLFCEQPDIDLSVSKEASPFTLRAFSYLAQEEDIVNAILLKEITLRKILDTDDEEILIKQEIIRLLGIEVDYDKLEDYRKKLNLEFFIERETEEDIFHLSGDEYFSVASEEDIFDDDFFYN